jgi:hypothetical protein
MRFTVSCAREGTRSRAELRRSSAIFLRSGRSDCRPRRRTGPYLGVRYSEGRTDRREAAGTRKSFLWSRPSLAEVLSATGHPVLDQTEAGLLRDAGYSLHANAKTKEGRQQPDRDAHLRHIHDVGQLAPYGRRAADLGRALRTLAVTSHPTRLFSRVGEHVAQSGPESQGAVADG